VASKAVLYISNFSEIKMKKTDAKAIKQIDLLKTRRFWPMFLVQFFGAFNDNLFKSALVMLITYSVAYEAEIDSKIIVSCAMGLFILPFFLFSATAGAIADKYEKSELIRMIKLAEILIMLCAVVGFFFNSIQILMFVLFLLGTQSAIFCPIKYSILPDHLSERELVAGNAWFQASNFFAILLGTIVSCFLVMHGGVGEKAISLIAVCIAVAGWYFSRFIPEAKPASSEVKVESNFIKETFRVIKNAESRTNVFMAIMGISWFWLVAVTFLGQFPDFAEDVLHSNEQVVTAFIAIFSIGVGFGALICNKMLKGFVDTTYVPLAALGMALFAMDLWWVSDGVVAPVGELFNFVEFMSHKGSFRIMIDLFMLSFFGGVYVVPLYALLQIRTEKRQRSRMVAANNIMNAFFTVISSVGTVFMYSIGFSITQVFLVVGLLNVGIGLYICRLLPRELLTSLLRSLFQLLFKVEVKNLEYLKQAGSRVVIIANHLSFLDAALLVTYIPGMLTFAMNTLVSEIWFIKPFLSLAGTYALDPAKPFALKGLVDRVKAGRKVVIFPEGRISTTGAIMKVYEGPGLIADKADANILPIRIEGAQYSFFSYLKDKVKRRPFPKITITLLKPRKFHVPEEIKGRNRRDITSAMLYDVMTDMVFESSEYNQPVYKSMLDAMAVHGRKHKVMDDINRKPLSYGNIVTKSMVVANALSKITDKKEYIGLMMPNMASSMVIFMSIQAAGRVPAMLNFSAGKVNLLSACKTAGLKKILTSKQFVKKAELEDVVKAIEESGVEIIYLENFAKTISIVDKVYGFAMSLFPRFSYKMMNKEASGEDDCVVLFTSGSEGVPKAVVLSHKNIQANCYQAAAIIDYGSKDVLFNALPIFHSFGLMAGSLLPLLAGAKTFYYPSPLHYRIVPELVYETNATIMFGTDTFLAGYANYAHPYDFYNIRYIVAGAEKLKDKTRQLWMEKFGLRILEGYGATETSPILTINTPMKNKTGTVGRFLPGIEHRLEPVEGIETGGRLFVKGDNVMKGYMFADKPLELVPPEGGWYDTGDIVDVDEDGFVSIKGRAKRFAKVGGEMVSLTAVEMYINELWENQTHAIATIPDEKKGEQLVLITDYKDAKRSDIVKYFRENGISELGLPKKIHVVEEVPLLGAGKINYVKAQELALEKEKK
jgi:acyl-[acyl-carrier-protein]-phospholipid O-acyltransferase/long-chain-fatty-acid--[acyl-carrier-protein] ligase